LKERQGERGRKTLSNSKLKANAFVFSPKVRLIDCGDPEMRNETLALVFIEVDVSNAAPTELIFFPGRLLQICRAYGAGVWIWSAWVSGYN
jgi:hypothetical protein